MRTIANTLWFVCVAAALSLELFSQSAPFEQAMQLFQQRQWAEAAAAFAECEKNAPGKTSALLYRGKSLVNLGEFDDAATALESYAGNHPQSEDAAYLLAYIRFRQNKPKDSLQLFNDAAKLKTPTADDLKIVALDYVLLNDYDDAARYLEESLAMDPANLETRYHLGRVRYQQNRFDEAIAAFQEVLRRDPGNVKAYDNLGLSLEAKNETEPAIAAYHKAIALDEPSATHNDQPYLNLGALLEKSNRTEEAISWLIQASTIAPTNGKAHYQLARAYFELNRLEKARTEAEKAVSLDAGESSDHYLLGRIYQRTGENDLAKEQFRITEQLVKLKGSASTSGMTSGMNPR
ncbi:MAG: tetratricopeptide repeat protein [Candidatus Sulfotelmatobacter sp.]